MAMSAALRQAFNDQIALEFSAAYAYLAMAAYLEDANLDGFSRWMQVQHAEEIEHAHKFFHFLLERGERPHLAALPEPGQSFASVEEVFVAALAHEQKVTSKKSPTSAGCSSACGWPAPTPPPFLSSTASWERARAAEPRENIG